MSNFEIHPQLLWLVSGQAVNYTKSAITFGSKVEDSIKKRLRDILQIHNDGGNGKYLGLPEHIGRNKKEIFNTSLKRWNAEQKDGLLSICQMLGRKY